MSVEKIWRVLTKSGYTPAAIGCLVAFLPMGCVAWLILSSTGNAPDNDYAELAPHIGQMLEPGYDWTKLARDSSMSSHCLLVPMLLHLVNIWLFKWDISLDLYGGLVLCLARVIVIDKMINIRGEGAKRSPLNALVLVAISGLSFGAANVSVLLYNYTAIAYGTTFLFFILGLFSLYHFGASKKGLALMALAGFATSFSNGGSAMFSWVAFGLYIATQKTKNRRGGLLTCVFCLAVTLAAVSYLIHSGGIAKATIRPHFPDIRMFLQCFALPFLKQTTIPALFTNMGLAIGLSGWLMAALQLILLLRRRIIAKPVGICLSLAAFASMNILAVITFRNIVAPWYDCFTALFWIAIIGVAVNLTTQDHNDTTSAPSPGKDTLRLALVAVPVCFVYAMFFCSNLSYRDKDAFRDTHGPASDSAMRHFVTCPTYGEANLFNFSIGSYGRVQALCEPLARHGLACFRTKKLLYLQGDYLFPQVRACLNGKNSDLCWIRGQSTRKHHEWSEPEHLNLALSGDTSVIWPVEIASGATQAILRTKYALAKSGKKGAMLQPLPGQLVIVDAKTSKQLFGQQLWTEAKGSWLPMAVDLMPYRGQSIKIKFSSLPSANITDLALAFESPRIEINDTGEKEPLPHLLTLQPANTELSPDFRGARPGDYLWPLSADLWDLYGLDRISPAIASDTCTLKATKALSSVTYKPALEIPVRAVDRFYIEIGVCEKIRPRAVCCQMVINGAYLKQIFIPLLDNGQMHRYTYDLKLCNFSSKDKITAFKILPIFNVEPGNACNIGIGKIGFLKS